MTAKKQRTTPPYELLYHPGIPGRGEYIRLPLEAAGVSYTDIARDVSGGYDHVLKHIDAKSTGDAEGNPPAFAPPALRIPGAGLGGKALVISQTPNILQYLAPKIGVEAEGEGEEKEARNLWVNELMLTALDLSNETHDTHHPVAVMMYYEDQIEESKKKAKDFRENRIPKYFSYFERTLKWNEGMGKGKYLVGSGLTVADTTFWQVVDGLQYAFPKEMAAREKDFPLIYGTFYPGIKEEKGLKEYLKSDRRQPYSMGLYRKYPELDRQ